MVIQRLQGIWKILKFTSLLAVILIVLYVNKLDCITNFHMFMMQSWYSRLDPINKINVTRDSRVFLIQSSFSRMEHELKPSCVNVTGNMVIGSWKNDTLKQSAMAEVVNFHKTIRTFLGIPLTLQRPDNRCGNVILRGKQTKGIAVFRALCDPNGSTPCCFENKCVLKTVEECRCKNCYDLRQKLHAELSMWIPADPACKITTFVGEEDSCKVLRDMTIYFMGDSFMRQLYISVLSLVRKNKPSGVLKKDVPADKIKHCDNQTVLLSKCSTQIRVNASECNNTTSLRMILFWKASLLNDILKHIQELQGLPNSIIIISIGLHEQFNLTVIENQVLKPLLLNLAKSPWPKLIWLSAQAPGLLKSPTHVYQQRDFTVKYNLRINDILRRKGIAILDFFQMTDPVMSFDGTHHGRGVADLKAQVLLNYILELRTSA